MNETEMGMVTGTEEPQEAPRKNFVQRLSGMYFEPRPVFEDIGRRGGWIGIFILICALAITSLFVLRTRMDYSTYMHKAIQMNPMTKNLSEEQIQAAVNRPESAFQRYSAAVFAPIGILVSYAIISGVLLLVFVLMGTSVSYKQSFAVTMWGIAPPAIVVTLLGILFMFLKDPENIEIDPSANVASNLGLLVAHKEHPVLSSLLSSIDVFTFWEIALLAIGFSVISKGKLTTGKAAVGVLIPWALWVLGKAGFAALFS